MPDPRNVAKLVDVFTAEAAWLATEIPALEAAGARQAVILARKARAVKLVIVRKAVSDARDAQQTTVDASAWFED